MITSPCRTLSLSAATNRSTSGCSPPVSIGNVSPTRSVQRVLQRRGVRDRRHGPIVERPVQKPPGVRPLGVRRRNRFRKRETAALDEARLRSDDRRVGRAIEVQAAGILPLPEAEPRDVACERSPVRRRGARPGPQAYSGSAQNRQVGLARAARNRRCPSGDRTTISAVAAPERIDREDDERRRRDQCGRQHAPARPRRGAAESETRDGPGAGGRNRASIAGPQPGREHEQHGDEQRPARPEERARLCGPAQEAPRQHPGTGDRQRGPRPRLAIGRPSFRRFDRDRSSAPAGANAESVVQPTAATRTHRWPPPPRPRPLPRAERRRTTCTCRSVVPTAPTHHVRSP